MMRKKGLFGILVSTLIIITIMHQTLHFTVFGTGISGFFETGISGLSIGKFYLGEELRKNSLTTSPISKIALIIEWSLLIIALIFIFIRNKTTARKEIEEIKSPQKYKKSERSTEIDMLYNMLKEKKHLRLSTIAKVFNVSKKVALSWAKTLEYGNLVTINYPKFGDPEIILNE